MKNEYRMVIKLIDENVYLFKLPFSAIKSIVLGCRASDSLNQKIKILISTKERIHIKLFESNIIRGSFCKRLILL